jgi:hypothetical protein
MYDSNVNNVPVVVSPRGIYTCYQSNFIHIAVIYMLLSPSQLHFLILLPKGQTVA